MYESNFNFLKSSFVPEVYRFNQRDLKVLFSFISYILQEIEKDVVLILISSCTLNVKKITHKYKFAVTITFIKQPFENAFYIHQTMFVNSK